MSFVRGAVPEDVATGDARARLARELGRLDAYSFWVVPAAPDSPGDLIVCGVTGVFLVAACGQLGALHLGRRPTIGRTSIPLRALRSGVKRLGTRLAHAAVLSRVEPVWVPTEATTGAPVVVDGVRLVHVRDLMRDLTARPRTLSAEQAQRAARVLGMDLAGDHRRHFSIHR